MPTLQRKRRLWDAYRFEGFRPETTVRVAYRPEPAPLAQPADPGLMPDLRGRSAREAAIAAARRGLIVDLKGSGSVVEQSLAPGTELEAGMTCVLVLSREAAVEVP